MRKFPSLCLSVMDLYSPDPCLLKIFLKNMASAVLVSVKEDWGILKAPPGGFSDWADHRLWYTPCVGLYLASFGLI